jgi:hypothetical protein
MLLQEDKYHTSIKPGDQGPSKPHISYLHSPVSRPIQTLSFYYHMHGTAMGTLSVEARQHKGPGHDEWKIVWSKKGQQQASASAAWAHAAVPPRVKASHADLSDCTVFVHNCDPIVLFTHPPEHEILQS